MRNPTFCIMVIMVLLMTYYSKIIEDSINSADIPQVDEPAIAFMDKYGIPELSLAISKDGKLIYAKAFSMNNTVSITNRFRIASVSKAITAVSVFKLIQQGKLSLTDKVFGPGGVLGTKYGHQPYGQWITEITVWNLLSHTSSGWGALDYTKDPMLKFPSWPVAKLITWTLDNIPLTSAPGTAYIYSNFGYCLLGRIIEQVTGLTYEHYVQSAVLAPIGITDMEIAGNTLADRKPNEVIYYTGDPSDPTEDPYSINIHRMDAHGGWITKATDLVRFLVHLTPDILNHETYETMMQPLSIDPTEALGWGINATSQWAAGSLPGNFAFMEKDREFDFSWSILMNKRLLTPEVQPDLEALVKTAILDPSTQWPDVDEFSKDECLSKKSG